MLTTRLASWPDTPSSQNQYQDFQELMIVHAYIRPQPKAG